MIIEMKIEFKPYLKLMYVLTYRKPAAIVISLIGFFSLLFGILSFTGLSPFFPSDYVQLGFGFMLVVVYPFIIYTTAKRNFASQARIQERITYEFTDNTIKITGESFNSELTWEKTYKVLELKDWILIYQNRLVANIIPKEAFGDKLDEFKSLVRSKSSIKQKLR